MAERGRGQSPSTMEDLLDVENKRMADSLASKVTRLKSLALDIDKDAEEQNRYLDGMPGLSHSSSSDLDSPANPLHGWMGVPLLSPCFHWEFLCPWADSGPQL
ncbi:BET1-like protein isoform X2 [Haemorhous mexicanus]|uniref:BET1-like protein isoform X2 n=1 Tax=Haemorhous mexicanus TaxID=30427 RepID=UPI0028BDC3CC|nr:BET1-like protein isoform X2 [Haemorhous mexicanus]